MNTLIADLGDLADLADLADKLNNDQIKQLQSIIKKHNETKQLEEEKKIYTVDTLNKLIENYTKKNMSNDKNWAGALVKLAKYKNNKENIEKDTITKFLENQIKYYNKLLLDLNEENYNEYFNPKPYISKNKKRQKKRKLNEIDNIDNGSDTESDDNNQKVN